MLASYSSSCKKQWAEKAPNNIQQNVSSIMLELFYLQPYVVWGVALEAEVLFRVLYFYSGIFLVNFLIPV